MKPLLTLQNEAYSRWLDNRQEEDLIQARGAARRGVRRANNVWFQEKAREVDRDRFWGKKVWNCIWDMQCGRRCQLPLRVATIHDKEGVQYVTTSAQHQRWRRLFTKVLNVRSMFDEGELELIQQREVDDSLGSVQSCVTEQKVKAMIKNGKAAGKSDILPKML